MSEGPWVSTVSVSLAGLLMLVSCVGWGRLLARWAGIAVDGGLMAAWGLAVLLALGGGAVALGVATAPVLLGIEVLGIVGVLWPPRPALPRLDRTQGLFLAGAGAVLLVRLVFATGFGALEPCDDLLAYQPLVSQLAQSGDLISPFSLRRLASYGGQVVLQVMTVPNGPAGAMNVADAALAPVLLMGLGWSFLRRYGQPGILPLGFVLLIGIGCILRNNSASQATTVVCFLAVVRTLYLLLDAERRLRLCVILGVLAAAASSLRQISMVFPFLVMLACLPGHAARWGMRAALKDAAVVAASWLVFLAPWMVALQISSGTPLYPVLKGNFNPAIPFATAVGGWPQVGAMVLLMLRQELILVPLLMAPVAFFVPADRRLRLVQGAALAGTVIIIAGFSGADGNAMARYVQPTLMTGMVLSLLGAMATGVVSSRLVRVGLGAAIVYGIVHALYLDYVRFSAPQPLAEYSATLLGERLSAYAEAQREIPAGSPIYVYVSAPYSFDFRRNRIFNADIPGPVSPHRGQPSFQGGEALAAYLRSLGIRYVLFEDFETAIVWSLRPQEIVHIVDPAGQAINPLILDTQAGLRQLSRTRRVLYDGHGVILLDLNAAAE